MKEFWETFSQAVADFLSASGINIAIAVIVLVLGLIIIKITFAAIKKGLIKRGKTGTVSGFLLSIAKAVMYLLLFLIIVSILGIPITSFLVIMGSAGVAIGLAMQGTLSNFINGLMLIVTRPFKKGDFVDLDGKSGTVKTIGMLHTTLTTPDNKLVFLSNTEAMQNPMTNFTFFETRRVEIKFFTALGSDIALVKRVVYDAAAAHPDVLDSSYKDGYSCPLPAPEQEEKTTKKTKKREKFKLYLNGDADPEKAELPMVALSEITQSSLNFILRVWTRAENFWKVFFELNEKILEALAASGITVPYQQLSVHIER